MDVTIRPSTDDRERIDADTNSLLTALLNAYGDSLPEHVERVEDKHDHYDIHMKTVDMGNAFGQVLTAHGWSIVGVHAHKTDGEGIDTISVVRTHTCDDKTTIYHSEGDEHSVRFEV